MKDKVFLIFGAFVLLAGCASAQAGGSGAASAAHTAKTGQGTLAALAEEEEYDPSFVAVTRALDILGGGTGIIGTGVPFSFRASSRAAGLPFIDVAPNNATNKTVILSVKDAGSTGATITGDTLNTTGVGTVTITATVTDGLGKGKPFTEDWTIYVARPPVVKGSYTVQETQGGWILTGYSGREANVTIPADLGVTMLSRGLFRDNQIITSVVVPEGVTRINEAFLRASNLQSVSLPSTLRILDGSFNRCGKLTSINIPFGVITITADTFNECSGLTSITIPASVTSIGECFTRCFGLTSITVEAVIPPFLRSLYGSWAGPMEKLTAIYVPRASVEAYKNADGWTQYAELIKGF